MTHALAANLVAPASVSISTPHEMHANELVEPDNTTYHFECYMKGTCAECEYGALQGRLFLVGPRTCVASTSCAASAWHLSCIPWEVWTAAVNNTEHREVEEIPIDDGVDPDKIRFAHALAEGIHEVQNYINDFKRERGGA